MFGGDDDDDFVPANNSKLASLFSSKSGGEGNTSLTYTAPKQPKRVGSKPGKNDSRPSSNTNTTSGTSTTASSNTQTPASNKLGIIIVKAVNTYKREDGNYNLQGKLGAAVLGNTTACAYQLLLYKGKQHHITSTKITPNFQYTVQPNNYGTFYDDQKQNWSLHFDHDEDAEEFAKEIGLARGNSQGGYGGVHEVLTQDLCAGDGPPANVGDSVEIFYSVRLFTECKLGQLIETNLQADKPQRVKIRKNVWEEGLIGATRGTKRIILLPSSLVGPWRREVPADSSVAVEVEVSRLKGGGGGLSSLVDSGESAVDSSTDETSIRARGASLTAGPGTHKADIISRMARMGQATLPLRGAVACDPSDSDDSEDEANGPPKPPIIFKPSHKAHSAKPKTPPQPPGPPEHHAAGLANMNMPPQQMAVYQSLPLWQQQPQQQAYTMGQYGIGQLDGQLYPLVSNQPISAHQLPPAKVCSPPGVPTPADSHLSVFLSETRTHNTEVRMGLAKVVDKVDQVLAKLDGSGHSLRACTSTALLDSTSLLASIQRLVSENEQLRSEVVDKAAKIDVQNDRIYQLLNTNHKYLEQSTVSGTDQRGLEEAAAGLRRENSRLAEELGGAREEARNLLAHLESCKQETAAALAHLQEELGKTKGVIVQQDATQRGLTDKLDTARQAQEAHEKTIATLTTSLLETQATNEDLRARLSETTHQLDLQKAETGETVRELNATKSLLETQESNDDLMAGLSEMTQRLSLQKVNAEETIKELNARHSAQLEALGADLARRADVEQRPSESSSYKLVVDEVKKVMNVVYKSLGREFITGETYLGEHIKETLVVTIRDVTCRLVERETVATPVTVKPQTVHASGNRQEESRVAMGGGEISRGGSVAWSESPSDEARDSKRSERDLPGCSGTPKELSVVSSEPRSKPAVDLPSAAQDTPRTDTNNKTTGSSTSVGNQMQRDASARPSELRFNAAEDLNPTADGPKDGGGGSSSSLPSYAGGNAGDIPTVPLGSLPGETDLSAKLVRTDSETMPEPSNHLRVTSDSCVSGTAPIVNELDDNRCDSMSAITPDSVTRPAMVSTSTDALKVDGQQPSTNEEEVVEVVEVEVRESSLERKPWRSEPPPLFDDDEDEDDWLS